jgi:hypothetical protein
VQLLLFGSTIQVTYNASSYRITYVCGFGYILFFHISQVYTNFYHWPLLYVFQPCSLSLFYAVVKLGSSSGEASTDQSVAQTLLSLLSTKSPLVVVDFFLQLPFPSRGNVVAGNMIQQLLAVARGDGVFVDNQPPPPQQQQQQQQSSNAPRASKHPTDSTTASPPPTAATTTASSSPPPPPAVGKPVASTTTSATATAAVEHSFRGFSISIRSEALWMLGRLARTYPWRLAQEWDAVDAALRKCYRCVEPALRLHAIKVFF